MYLLISLAGFIFLLSVLLGLGWLIFDLIYTAWEPLFAPATASHKLGCFVVFSAIGCGSAGF
jgi:hypothetical protein